MAPRLTKAFGSLASGALIALACGGQSLEESDGGDGSNGGDAGTAGGGTGGSSTGGSAGSSRGGTSAGGAFSGGTSAGGTFSGGTFSGGTFSGGTFSGGTSAGGSSAGGVAGTGGAAGAGGVCSLPLETGNCDAYFPSFGFSQADGRCVPFVYGGCGGNDNRFATLVECEARCGGSLSKCPPELPASNAMCSSRGQECTYDFASCLCAPTAPYNCIRIEPSCGALPDAGVSPIVIAAYHHCTCEATGWECGIVTYGGR